jgi:hypothetical protein
MTPVYTQKGASRVLTKRTCRDHPTQIKFEINTQNRFDPLNPAAWKDIKTSRHQDIKTSAECDSTMQPGFYEHLFGFPQTFSSCK